MALVEKGAVVEVRISPTLLVRVIAQGPANLGEDIDDPILEADQGGVLPGGPFLLTQSAFNVGEARLPSSAQAGLALLLQSSGDQAPLTFTAWAGNGLWTYDASKDNLTRLTAVVNDQYGSVRISGPWKQYVVRGQCPVGLSISADIRFRGIADVEYPAAPDFSDFIPGTGSLQTLSIDISGYPYPAAGSLGMQVKFSTKGGGGNNLYQLFNHYLVG